MCTIGLNRQLNVIFKNRDKNVPVEEEIVTADNYIAVRTRSAAYYSLGLNTFGCGFVSAAINSPEWTRLAGEGKRDQAQALFKNENRGLISPMIMVSRMLPEVRSIEEWIDALAESKDSFRGYNILLADLSQAKAVEVFRKQRNVRPLSEKEAITNHFKTISFGPQVYNEYSNSFDRYDYAAKTVKKSKTLEDMFDMLKSVDPKKRQRIWREGHFFTVSTSIRDLFNKCLYYSSNPDENYKTIALTKKGAEISHGNRR